jgi:hypothetical protein
VWARSAQKEMEGEKEWRHFNCYVRSFVNGHLFAVVGFIQNRTAPWEQLFQCENKKSHFLLAHGKKTRSGFNLYSPTTEGKAPAAGARAAGGGGGGGGGGDWGGGERGGGGGWAGEEESAAAGSEAAARAAAAARETAASM